MELIWDFDGTLFDTYPLMAQSLRQALLDEGRGVPLEHIRALMNVTLGHALEQLKVSQRALERYKEICTRRGRSACNRFPAQGSFVSGLLQRAGIITSARTAVRPLVGTWMRRD